MMTARSYLLVYCLLLIPLISSSQSSYVHISDITISGAKRTKENIISRELDFRVGDSIQMDALMSRLQLNERLVMNTSLFNSVKINVSDWPASNNVTISVAVEEAFYIYPIPIFELADRFFNVWWTEQNRAINRINFGLRFYHLNLTGNKDQLKLVTQFGYTQKYELEYRFPYLNKNQNLGFIGNLLYTRNKEVGYETDDNRLQFRRFDDDVLLQRYRIQPGLTFRKNVYSQHTFKVGFFHNTVKSIVVDSLNTDFFLDGRSSQSYLNLSYTYAFDRRDIKPYPIDGYYLEANVEKDGIGVFDDRNNSFASLLFAHYIPFSEKWSLGYVAKGRYQLQNNQQAYFNNRALGYEEDFLRGYEFYVIDGMHYGYLKTSLRYNLITRSFDVSKYMPIRQFKKLPLKIYLTLNGDYGYVYDRYYLENNSFKNRNLWGGGLGLDFVLYFDKVIRLEYSTNHIGENALFLHYKLAF